IDRKSARVSSARRARRLHHRHARGVHTMTRDNALSSRGTRSETARDAAPDTPPTTPRSNVDVDDVEEGLIVLARRSLGVPSVRPRAVSFDKGGTWFAAPELCADIRERFGVDLPVHTVIEARSIRALALRIRAAMGAHASSFASGSTSALLVEL